jgi:hypothetical protein
VLLQDEVYVADKGYRSEYALLPSDAWDDNEKRYMELARARHEQVNRLFKLFKVLSNTFRQDVKKHKYFMLAVANIANGSNDRGDERL